MKYWAHCQQYNLETSLWKFYYDDPKRKRDEQIKYAYQADDSSCGLFILVTEEALTFRPSISHDTLFLRDFLSPARIKSNHYRLVLAALIMLFKHQQFFQSCPTESLISMIIY